MLKNIKKRIKQGTYGQLFNQKTAEKNQAKQEEKKMKVLSKKVEIIKKNKRTAD